MKAKPAKKAFTLPKQYKTFITRKEAEFEALKATCGVEDSSYISTFSIDGQFFFTITEEEGVALRTQIEEEGVGVRWHGTEENDITEGAWKLFRKWYNSEVMSEIQRLVPASHPQHKAIWKAHKNIADGSADGLGGEYQPKSLVADSMRMYINPLEVWKEFLEAACCRLFLRGSEAAEKMKQWTKGKTIYECVGSTKEEWQSYNVYTDEDLEEFAYHFVKEELDK